jgi:hypothetical protein
VNMVAEPLCEKCGTDVVGGRQERLDDYRVRCGSCGHVFVPYDGWDAEEQLDLAREILIGLERHRAAGPLPTSLEAARQAAFTVWLHLAWYAVRDQAILAHQITPVTMHDGVRWELDDRTRPPQIVPTSPEVRA